MPKTIYKFEIETLDKFHLTMPKEAEILCVQMQGQKPCIWAKVDPENNSENRTFKVYGTGHPIYEPVGREVYIGTYQLMGGSLVFHLFELKKI